MNNLWYRLNEDGTTTPLDDPARMQPLDQRRVERTDLDNGVWVSTVFLGLDHSWNGPPPILFETMVFPADSMLEEYCERYATIDEARAGHERVVAALRAGRDPGDES